MVVVMMMVMMIVVIMLIQNGFFMRKATGHWNRGAVVIGSVASASGTFRYHFLGNGFQIVGPTYTNDNHKTDSV